MNSKIESKKFGWYSLRHDIQSGYALYETSEGTVVKVTSVQSSSENCPWEDAIFMGEVTKCIETNSQGFDKNNFGHGSFIRLMTCEIRNFSSQISSSEDEK